MRNTLKKAFLALAISMGILSFSAIPAKAADFLPETGTVAAAPAGYIMFCMKLPGECAGAGVLAPVVLDKATWKLINKVNEDVNEDIWPMDDRRHYGRAEYWTIPTDGYGDCDDYAVTKRHRLIAAGLPAAALRIAVVVTARGEKHAVLTITTDRGDYVLDNQRDEILPWSKARFFWISRQSASVASGWEALNLQG